MTELPFALLFIAVSALALDRLLGEPRLHPLVWFGHLASEVESRLNKRSSRWSGIFALLLVVLPLAIVTFVIQRWLSNWPILSLAFSIYILMFVIGWQSMKEHARAVAIPLKQRKLVEAREALAMIVSRDTADLDETAITGSVIESVLENGHDSVFASLFWFAVAGPCGALVHRLVNTLDAMWGYRTERYARFGWAAARLDDVLGYIPARLTALSFAVCGNTRTALRCWQQQAPLHKSPNAGVVMATGAGALGVAIGGPMSYHGKVQDKPDLGEGVTVHSEHIGAAIALVHRALWLWMLVFAIACAAVSLIA